MTNGLSKDQINWAAISEPDFNHLVEVLLLKMHPTAKVIRGDGGDGGIDVGVWTDGVVTRIYQLKYFPEGFTGGFRRTRKPQVEESFETAWRNHKPKEWILVMPKDPHVNELTVVQNLAVGKEVDVDIWGKSKLSAGLVDHPAVEGAFLRDGLVDVLTRVNQERAGLIGPTDLTERVGGLLELANTRSKYWDTTVTVQNGTVFEDYTPKHPNAMDAEPIVTKLTVKFGPEHQAVRDQLQESMDFGLLEDLDLPGEAASLIRTGPQWVAPYPQVSMQSIRLSPSLPQREIPKPKTITLSVVDYGYTKGKFEGLIIRQAQGERGVSMSCLFENVVTMKLRIPWPDSDEDPRCTLNFDVPGAQVRDVHAAMMMRDSFQPNRKLELYADGIAGTIELKDLSDRNERNEWTDQLVSDLFFVQNALGNVSFVVPEETGQRERINLRIARLLLEGKRTVLIPGQSMSLEMSGESNERFEQILLEGGAVLAKQTSMPFEIQGSTYDLGPGYIYHPHVIVKDGQEHWKALNAGEGNGRVVTLTPADGSPFRVGLRSNVDNDPDDDDSYELWNVPNIENTDIKEFPSHRSTTEIGTEEAGYGGSNVSTGIRGTSDGARAQAQPG